MPRTKKIAFKEIAKRITGVSIPVFGIQWNPPEFEREVVRETFIFLEDRRALYNDYAHEIDYEVAESVLAIRTELTGALKRLPEASEAVASFKSMRAACREYLDGTRGDDRKWNGLNRCFIFKDRQVESIHVALNTFVRQNMPQDISNLPAIDKLKDEEWQYLNTLIRLY